MPELRWMSLDRVRDAKSDKMTGGGYRYIRNVEMTGGGKDVLGV